MINILAQCLLISTYLCLVQLQGRSSQLTQCLGLGMLTMSNTLMPTSMILLYYLPLSGLSMIRSRTTLNASASQSWFSANSSGSGVVVAGLV